MQGLQYESELIYLPVRAVTGVEHLGAIEIYDYELEALRLVHLEGLRVEDAALRLGVSKVTLWRALESCRSKLARALVEQRPIRVVRSSATPSSADDSKA